MTRQASPLLSVVSVTFNAERELPRTLGSLASQSSRNFESIIVDGGSKDDTLRVAEEFQDRFPMSVYSEPDDGLYHAMNKGIGLAKGRFIVFMNAGDCFADSEVIGDLEMFIEGLPRHPAMIYGETIIRHHDGAKWLRPIRPLGYIRHGQPSLHQATIFDRMTHSRYLYPFSKYEVSADYAAMAAIHRDCGERIVRWNRPFAIFFNNPRSASNSRFRARIADAWHIQRDILKQPVWRRIGSVVRRTAAHAYYNFRFASDK